MWNNRNVWIILVGEFIAGVGLWTGIIGNLEFMQAKIPSDFMKSILLATGILAGIAVGPLAGKVTDRFRKKTVMVFAGFGRMVSVLFIFLAIYTDSIWWMVLFLITIQISAAFYFPALQSAIPLIVAEKELLRMNSVHMNVATMARIIGTALAGAMLVVMSIFMLYFASFIGYLFLFIFTLFLHINEENEVQNHRIVKEDKSGFKDVLPVIKQFPVVLMTLILTLVPALFLGGFNLMVINISEIYEDPAIKGIIYATEGIAFMIGTFVAERIGRKMSPYFIMFFFSGLMGLAQLTLFFVDIKMLALAAFAIFGFSIGCFFPTAATIFQTRMPKKYHGRFFSFRNMLDRMVFQVVLLGTGLLLDIVGLRWMVVIFGIVSLTTTIVFYQQYRHRREDFEQSKVASAQV